MPKKGKGPGKGKGCSSQDAIMAQDTSLDQASQSSLRPETDQDAPLDQASHSSLPPERNQDAFLDEINQSAFEQTGESLSQGMVNQLRSLINEELQRFRTPSNSSKGEKASSRSPVRSLQECRASGSGASGSRDSAIREHNSDSDLSEPNTDPAYDEGFRRSRSRSFLPRYRESSQERYSQYSQNQRRYTREYSRSHSRSREQERDNYERQDGYYYPSQDIAHGRKRYRSYSDDRGSDYPD